MLFTEEQTKMLPKVISELPGHTTEDIETAHIYNTMVSSKKFIEYMYSGEALTSRPEEIERLKHIEERISQYEWKLMSSPIYDEIIRRMGIEGNLPDFLRDDATITGRAEELVEKGWYQNSRGDLYYYDGIVWDNIPSEKIMELEFLGNG